MENTNKPEDVAPFDGDLLPKYCIAMLNETKRTIDFTKGLTYHQDEDTGAYFMSSTADIPLWLRKWDAEAALKQMVDEGVSLPGYEVWHMDDLLIAHSQMLAGELEVQSMTSMITTTQFALADMEAGVPDSWTDWIIGVSDQLNELYSYHAKKEREDATNRTELDQPSS